MTINTTSGLEANNAQDAIDELAGGGATQTMQDSYDDSSVPQITLDNGTLTSGDLAQALLRIRNNAQTLMFFEVKNNTAGQFHPSVGILGDAPNFDGAVNIGTGNTYTAGLSSVLMGSNSDNNGIKQ